MTYEEVINRAKSPTIHGGYESVFLMKDGEWLCHSCVVLHEYAVQAAMRYKTDGQWEVVGIETSDMLEHFEKCSHCERGVDGHHDELAYSLHEGCETCEESELCERCEKWHAAVGSCKWTWHPLDEGGYLFDYTAGDDEEALFVHDLVQSLDGSLLERDGNYIYCVVSSEEPDDAIKELEEAYFKVEEGA